MPEPDTRRAGCPNLCWACLQPSGAGEKIKRITATWSVAAHAAHVVTVGREPALDARISKYGELAAPSDSEPQLDVGHSDVSLKEVCCSRALVRL